MSKIDYLVPRKLHVLHAHSQKILFIFSGFGFIFVNSSITIMQLNIKQCEPFFVYFSKLKIRF